MFLFALIFSYISLTSCTNQNINVPTIKSIELLDLGGKPLAKSDDGWIKLQAKTIIKVDFDGDATYVEYYTVPTGTEVLLEQRIIGAEYVKKGDKTVQFEWQVPYGFLGNIWVVVYNGDIGRTSDTNQFFIKAFYE